MAAIEEFGCRILYALSYSTPCWSAPYFRIMAAICTWKIQFTKAALDSDNLARHITLCRHEGCVMSIWGYKIIQGVCDFCDGQSRETCIACGGQCYYHEPLAREQCSSTQEHGANSASAPSAINTHSLVQEDEDEKSPPQTVQHQEEHVVQWPHAPHGWVNFPCDGMAYLKSVYFISETAIPQPGSQQYRTPKGVLFREIKRCE